MKFRQEYSRRMFSKAFLLRVMVLCLLFSGLPINAYSAEITFPKRVTINWQSSENQLFYFPGGDFLTGKQVNKKVLDSETKRYCTRHFGFTNITVKGASRRIFGTSNAKNTKFSNSHKFVSGKWILDENGEDVYELIYRCSGAMSVLIKSRSSAYSFTIANLQTKLARDPYDSLTGGFFLIEDLEKSNWTLSALFPKNYMISSHTFVNPEWSILENEDI